ncbi:acyl-CoA-binding domain-containing protein 3 isoform X1 [Lactuca sativa]|uniref:acyl-CoA-binding domain-containing protein 3 isoform X1 n=1 Tax=Lactuca sativa TaxID=4236 RepID=UPI001C692408|nr:acyl-CoA-binding domain-containing protein 3 isoform X1 [Lactuca sativa]
MELFQELVFTISFSLIVSLLIAKLFSMSSSCDDGTSTLSKSVEEKIEREWVVCDSEKEEKSGYFEDAVRVSEDVLFGYAEAEFLTEYVIDDPKSVGGVGESYVFDESPQRTESKEDAAYSVKSDEGNVVDPVLASDMGSSIQEACVKSIEAQQESSSSVDENYMFDESPQRAKSKQLSVYKSGEGNVVDPDTRSSKEEDTVKSIEEQQESSSPADVRYVFDETPQRTKSKDDAVYSVKSVFASDISSSTQEDCIKTIEEHHESSAIDVGEVKLEEREGVFDDDWQGIETTELERRFGAAVAFLGSKTDRLNLIDNEVKMQFYGLHRVAIEGPCFESQPMALKVSARANWNAWKRLKNLGREDAMEQYIALLSQHIPDWMGTHVCVRKSKIRY